MGPVTEGSPEPGSYVRIDWQGRKVSAWLPAKLGERFLQTASIGLTEPTARRTEQAANLATKASADLPASWVPIARLLARSEGIASSVFEGIASTPTEVALAVSKRGGSPAAVAVAENVTALAAAMSQSSVQFSIELLHEWHRILMTHATYLPGEMIGGFRTQQGWIGGSSPVDAALVTAPPEYLGELMNDLVMFINDTSVDAVTQAAIAHAQFETIHPYGDGNGRVGRVLISWMLAKHLDLRVAPPVSVHLARDRGGYLSGLVMFQQGLVDPWVRWFADTVARAATSSNEIAVGVAALLSNWDSRLSHLRSDSVARRVLSLFPEHYVVTATDVVEATGVSDRSARSALAELGRIGICGELSIGTTGVGRPQKLWIAPELAALLPG